MTIDIVPIYNIDIVIESQQRLRQETFTATLPEVCAMYILHRVSRLLKVLSLILDCTMIKQGHCKKYQLRVVQYKTLVGQSWPFEMWRMILYQCVLGRTGKVLIFFVKYYNGKMHDCAYLIYFICQY